MRQVRLEDALVDLAAHPRAHLAVQGAAQQVQGGRQRRKPVSAENRSIGSRRSWAGSTQVVSSQMFHR